IGHTVWWGGQNIDKFIKGTIQYQHVLAAVTSARGAAARMGRELRVIIRWCQGENDTAGYLDMLRQLQADLREDVRVSAGMSTLPPFVIQQVNGNADTVTGIQRPVQAQYEILKEGIPGLYGSGPMYDCPLGDNIHASYFGRMIQAARDAHAVDSILRGLSPMGLRPTSFTRMNATTLRITWQLPPDATALSWSSWTPDVAQRGFEIWQQDGTDVPLSAVTISGAATLDLVGAADLPTTPLRIRSAMQISGPALEGWSRGRTTLEAVTPYRTFWRDQGFAIPEFVAYPAMRFEEIVA
ncbi:hypothetical protein, partial [Teichococcus aestuarii]